MNQDFRDLLAEFNAHSVEYMVVGAHALAAHGRVRATKDLDVWIRLSPVTARSAGAPMQIFGASRKLTRSIAPPLPAAPIPSGSPYPFILPLPASGHFPSG